jgi:hypothetical protein
MPVVRHSYCQKSSVEHEENGVKSWRISTLLWSPGETQKDGNESQIKDINQVQHMLVHCISMGHSRRTHRESITGEKKRGDQTRD